MTAAKEMSQQQFAGKVVVVTGGAQEIGRAIAGRFHAARATVWLVDRDALHDQKAVQEMTLPPGQRSVKLYEVNEIIKWFLTGF
jgi:NAD(P)-dependent dehydrogenase (short-subunit alcohol dehydrogenase family)